jgi:phosphohistidine phosphatase SixA
MNPLAMSNPAALLKRLSLSPLLALLCLGWLPLAQALEVPVLGMNEAAKKLAAGGYVLMMRHGSTEPGVGDPPGMKLADCKTQRNLSDEGRTQVKKLGEAFKAAGIRVDEVSTSEWCRCKETADLAFGKSVTWSALNSFFPNLKRQEMFQNDEIKKVLPYIKPPKNSVWVTHQVNITSVTGFVPTAAEVIAIRWVKDRVVPEFRFAPLK